MAKTVTLMQAAAALRLGYHATLNAVLRGNLHGFQNQRGRWMVDATDLERYAGERGASGRRPASRRAVTGTDR